MKSRLVLLMLLVTAAPVQAAVWENRNQWNEQWEARYGQWLEQRVGPDFFTKGTYAGIAHDCADAVYFTRLLFAYEHKLPFVILDSRSADGATLSNQMGDFDDQPPTKRLRRFMNLVGGQVSTNTLMRDTYPVALNRQAFRPGVVAALPRIYKREADGSLSESSGHGQFVTKVEPNGVIHYLKSTVPAKVQELVPTTLNSFVPAADGGSFRYWKQPQHYGRRESSLPGYGTDQYNLGGVFADALQQRIAQVEETRDERLSRLSGEVCSQVQHRVPIVDEAWAFKKKIGSRCMSYEEFDAYSTPSRDHKIQQALQYLVYSATGSETGPVQSVAQYLDQACGRITYLPGKAITAAKFAERLMEGKVSSDPNQPPSVRWGDEEVQALGCKQYY